jgi:hypothetical protein|tara:strand:- start:2399 stop:2623 length:225 start_codon:yes stop_codon:yes gene_type:complete
LLLLFFSSGDHFAKMLRPLLGAARYHVWVNEDPAASFIRDPTRDPYGDQADTRVDVDAFRIKLGAAVASVGVKE